MLQDPFEAAGVTGRVGQVDGLSAADAELNRQAASGGSAPCHAHHDFARVESDRAAIGRDPVRQVRRLGPLGPNLTEVEVMASGELLGAELRVAVPLVPAVEVGLPAVRLAGEPAVLNGVSIQVTNAVLGVDRTVLLLRVDVLPPAGFVWLGQPFRCRIRGEELVLRDAQDREYLEELPTGVGFSHDQTVFDDVVHFPPLPPDASGLRLVVPLVTLARDPDAPQAIDGPWIAPLGI